MSARMERGWADAYGREWIASWNRRALDQILTHYDDEVIFRSELAAKIAGANVLRGKAELERYWTEALEQISDLKFELLSVFIDEEHSSLLVHYVSRLNGTAKRAAEISTFRNGKIVCGEAFYGIADKD